MDPSRCLVETWGTIWGAKYLPVGGTWIHRDMFFSAKNQSLAKKNMNKNTQNKRLGICCICFANTVDGSEIRLTRQLRLVVEIPLFTVVLAPSKRWGGLGISGCHQQYRLKEVLDVSEDPPPVVTSRHPKRPGSCFPKIHRDFRWGTCFPIRPIR